MKGAHTAKSFFAKWLKTKAVQFRRKKKWKKVREKFGNIGRVHLSLHPLSGREKPLNGDAKKGSEKFFEKNLPKILEVQKNGVPLHHFPLRNSDGTEQTRNVLHSNIGTAFFEVFEQLNSFSHSLRRVISKTITFEIRAKDLNKIHYFTMESLILAQDER